MMKHQRFHKMMLRLFLLLFLLPLPLLFLWSLTARWPWPEILPKSFTLRGFIDLVTYNDQIWKVILSNSSLSFGVSVICLIISIMTARFVYVLDDRLKQKINLIIQLPFIVPATIFAMGIHVSFIQWHLADTVIGVMLVHIIYSLPYTYLIIHQAYQSVGESLEEQALVLGAHPIQAFISTTFPLLMPVFFSALSMAFIVSFSQYFLTLVIGGGSVQTYMTMIFPYFQNNDRTIAAVYSMLFLGMSLVFFLILHQIMAILQRKYQAFTYYDM